MIFTLFLSGYKIKSSIFEATSSVVFKHSI